MRRLERLDLVLLATLLPIFAVVLALHVREAHRTGLAQPPVFAVPGPGAYPTVGGLRLERGADWSGLEPGDVLRRIGDRDLRGVGHLGFEAIALEEAGREGVAPLVFERDGVRRTMDLAMRRHDMPWYRLPFLLGFVGVALLVLLRAPGTTGSRLFFAAFLGLAILETPFMGGPYLQTRAHYAVFHAFGPVAVGLLLAWMTRFPEQVPEGRRLSPWIGLVGLLFLVVRLPYFLGGPTPPHWTPSIVLLCDAFFMVTGLVIIGWNAYHADSLGRRRLKWFALGVVLGVGPLLLTMVAQPFGVPPDRFRQLFQIAVLFVVLVPIGILIGILRSGLFDIDRLLSSTAAYSLALVGVLGAALALAPDLVASLARTTGLSEGVVGPLAALAVAGGVVPLGRRLRPHLDRVFFPERVMRERGLQRLLRDLSDCGARDELLALLGERLEALLRLEGVRVLVADDEALAPADAPPGAPRLPRRGALARALERDPVPLVVDERSLARVAPELADEERALLEALRARVLLPVRRGKDLAAVVALGPKRSGDLFPPTELTLLDALAEKASAELLRLRDARALEDERTRAETLHRLHQETEAASRARSRFLAAASHDLRQPLHALGLFAERLAARAPDAETGSLAEQIRISVGSLATQFDALLDVSRLDTGTVVPEIREVALRPELASLASELEQAAGAKGLALRFEAEDLVVRSDPVLLRRIVQNLLANAVRYTEQGEVRLHARAEQGECILEVVDTG
ncbi:MAG: HAMP domain-containing sensor histidine kinase, partial [Myxococcota bacterium]|nr:HAMP domain-containing sensor histidine kinase [Myxococcota bacterium]